MPANDKNKTVKAAVRERDGYRCVKCGMTDEASRQRWGKGLEVHRVIPGSAYSLAGCTTRCKKCHAYEPRRPRRPRKPLLGASPVRIEIVVPPGWTGQLDAAARAIGLKRSAYIRMACSRQMKCDHKTEKG